MFYFCGWKTRFDPVWPIRARTEEVERKKSRWRTYRLKCYLHKFETTPSPPRERSRLQTTVAQGIIFFDVDAQAVKMMMMILLLLFVRR